MKRIESGIERTLQWSSVLIVALLFTLLPAGSLAKTPDGAPPAVESPCSGLTGAAYGLCNAYCEAQDCDVHARPSCAQLLANFSRVTGMSSFPCDVACGNGIVDAEEECDPGAPISACACQADCTCAVPSCCECDEDQTEVGCTSPDPDDGCPQGCTPGPAGSLCNLRSGFCAPPQVCCACEGPSCFQGTAEACELEGCVASSANSSCTDDGTCVGIGPAP